MHSRKSLDFPQITQMINKERSFSISLINRNTMASTNSANNLSFPLNKNKNMANKEKKKKNIVEIYQNQLGLILITLFSLHYTENCNDLQYPNI